MSEVAMRPGWLGRQLERNAREVASWPACMSGKFDAAINGLSVMADRDFANGAPHRGQFRAAIRVLEEAGKVDKAKSIDRGFQRDCFSKEEIDAIVARLRAADALCSAAKEIEEPEGVIFSDGIGYRTVRIDLFDRFRQAIAAYKDGQ